MQQYILELSKYFLAVCMLFYTFECFWVFKYREEEDRKGSYMRQIFFLFLIQLCCFADLALVNHGRHYVTFYLFVQAFLTAVLILVPVIYKKANRLLLNNLCMLLGIGLCVISRLSFQKAVKQYVISVISLMISLAIPYLLSRIRFLKKLVWIYAAAGILLIGLVLILGETTLGSKLSFSIGGLAFQPSEFVKIIFLFFLAGALWENISFTRILATTALAGIHIMILVVSKDLGSALIFFVGFVLVVFMATKNYWYLVAGCLGGGLAAWGAYFLFDHVKTRVLAWQDPWSYIDNQGFQITQSLFGVGSGSWFGMGLMQGNPKAIPLVEADFIFSAVCEELGVIFGVCLILMCVSCFLMMMEISVKVRDRFYQIIVYGIGVTYIFQIFLTVGGGIKFIPLTGVTLPFVSYGGSSVMSTMIMFFIVQGIYIRLQEEGGRHHVRRTEKAKNTGQQA